MTPVDLVETLLPGVGIRYEFKTQSGLRIGVVVRREGGTEVAAYDQRDPDRARGVFRLNAEETDALAEILGAPRMSQRFADLSREVPGLHTGRIAIRPGSPYAGRALGDTRTRTTTGCSIVAIVRNTEVVTSPQPTEILQTGDVLVVIGSQQGLEQVEALLRGQT